MLSAGAARLINFGIRVGRKEDDEDEDGDTYQLLSELYHRR